MPRQDRHIFCLKFRHRDATFQPISRPFFDGIMNSAKRVLVSFQIVLFSPTCFCAHALDWRMIFPSTKLVFSWVYKQFKGKIRALSGNQTSLLFIFCPMMFIYKHCKLRNSISTFKKLISQLTSLTVDGEKIFAPWGNLMLQLHND